jgi:HK97 family phage portal protein
MGIFKKREKLKTRPVSVVTANDFKAALFSDGYTSIDRNPEVNLCINIISNLVASMTIFLMENTENGDKRVKNALSNKIDRNPNNLTGRYNFIDSIIRELILTGNAIVLIENEGMSREGIPLLKNLIPIPQNLVIYQGNQVEYEIFINNKKVDKDNVLHFKIGTTTEKSWLGNSFNDILNGLVENLTQAQKTKVHFYKNPKPSLLLKIDGNVEGMDKKEGRTKIAQKYLETTERGEPYVIPADMLELTTITPQTLKDLAINEGISVDRSFLAKILGIPTFLIGVGEFNEVEYNNFISTTILKFAKILEQELTEKLLYAENLYFKFNIRSLMAYNASEMRSTAESLIKLGIGNGDEARIALGYEAIGLTDINILENFIPIKGEKIVKKT